MAQNRPHNVVLHPDPAPGEQPVGGGLAGLYAEYVRRILAQSGLSNGQKWTVLDRVTALLRQQSLNRQVPQLP